jgi:hypothetical protein
MLKRVISGGQTGADQAGWRAARAIGIPTGGWMPKGFLTEDGPRPEFAELYGARETQSRSYPERTRRNAINADAMLLFGDPDSRGGRLVRSMVPGPWVVIWPEVDRYDWKPGKIAAWLNDAALGCRTLLVAGNRESKAPGIGKWVERYLAEVFRLLAEDRGPDTRPVRLDDQAVADWRPGAKEGAGDD